MDLTHRTCFTSSRPNEHHIESSTISTFPTSATNMGRSILGYWDELNALDCQDGGAQEAYDVKISVGISGEIDDQTSFYWPMKKMEIKENI
ncbi:hypothetical protein AMTR_s00007p00098220 [Amborella trichopoda]|uniref:Uncharacterized protein n=1 Tax=Amborella trichopoda TaxID=13333 RepID=W1P5W6_AMBTC|nr:hypothetical protein AMTR_s00007p00098220 [Amborella trichopoda]